MQALDAILSGTIATDPWPARRQRTDELASRYPHAADILRLYRALIDPMADAFHSLPSPLVAPSIPSPLVARSIPSPLVGEGQGGGSSDLAAFAVRHVLPGIIDATVEAGPPVLRDGVIALFASADLEDLMRRWLIPSPLVGEAQGGGSSLTPVETYLARVTCGPLLEALIQSGSPLANQSPSPHVGEGRGRSPSPLVGEGRGGGLCPNCGGLPQLSYHALSSEPLVSAPRYLLCSRCSQSWIFSRMTCASCGESDGTRLPIYQESERLPHARVDGCQTCRRYLLTFDLRRDSRAVPIVDELACLPLDLYARDQGLTKIAPNLMGN